ncbi:MAG: murein biosynthesis integral membrane protein MurJ [Candidatus Sumerlaeota bacterium]|nr:murein biosynthesis integral membrane protein MurJ [Candidatus Sumerlaeota bacterium]
MTQVQHRVVRAAGLLMAANLVSRVLGQLRDTAIAAWFGQNAFTDVYCAAFQIPDLLFFLLAGGVFSSAFVPVITKYFSDGQDEEAWKVFSILATLLTIAIGALVVFGEVLARILTPLMAPGLSDWKLDLTANLTRIILPGQVCFFLGGLFMAIYYVRGRFLIPAVAPIVYNLGIIIGGWLGVRLMGERQGVTGLAWGALAGAFIGNFVLPVIFLPGIGARFRVSLNLKHPGVRRVGMLALPVLLGLSLPQVYAIINKMFGSTLQEGVITALDRANRQMQAPLGIFAQSICIAVFPAMAAMAARGEREQLNRAFGQGLRALWFISLPLSLVMMILSTDIVTVLLQYRHFTAANTEMTAQALVFYCVGLFAFSSQSLLNRAFYAVQDTVTPVIIGTLTTVVFVALNFALIHPMAHRGLALAGSLASIVHTIWMLGVLKKKTGIAVSGLAAAFARTLLAALVAAGIGWLIYTGANAWLHSSTLDPRLASLCRIFAVCLASGGVYLAAAKALRIEEMDFTLQLVARRLRRSQ